MSYLIGLDEKVNQLSSQIARTSGCSDVLFSGRFQAALERLLNEAPADERPQVEEALIDMGYEPDFKPYEPRAGECSLTGIDVNCCPCGHHL